MSDEGEKEILDAGVGFTGNRYLGVGASLVCDYGSQRGAFAGRVVPDGLLNNRNRRISHSNGPFW